MLLATSNKSIQLLMVSYVGDVRQGEIMSHQAEATALMTELLPGFRLLADFSNLESMDTKSIGEFGKMMELIDQAGVGLVVRVVPDPSKDFGLNILTVFHYRKDLQVITCESMVEALKALEL